MTLHRSLAAQRGFSLIELMISVTIGMLLLLGLTALFVNNSKTRDEIERANQQTDNGRYAMQVIGDDLRNAGYLAQFDPSSLALPAGTYDPCATDLASLRAALPLAIQGFDRPAVKPSCLSDVADGTDILVVRRASTCEAGNAECDDIPSGAPLFQASACSAPTELSSPNPLNHFMLGTGAANLTLRRLNCTTRAPVQRYQVHIYFVANNDKPGDKIPTLKRAELSGSGFTIVPLVEGIENLQFEYGIDTASPSTGNPAAFTPDPDEFNSCTPVQCLRNWRTVPAVRVHVLARNTLPSMGYQDRKTYTLGLDETGAPYQVSGNNDPFRRHAYSTTVRLHNVAGRTGI